MSRPDALFLFILALAVPPAFSADPPAGTTAPAPKAAESQDDDIDPTTGLARTTEVRPLREFPAANQERKAGAREAIPAREAIEANARPHIALILPISSPTLGSLADAVRQGFLAAAEAEGKGAPPVTLTAIDSEGQGLLDACHAAQKRGAMLVVAGLTRDGATALARSDCPRVPVLALNEPQGARAADAPGSELPANLYYVSLSLEQEARQAALMAVADGRHSAMVIASPSPLARRVQEAFEREWVRAAGEVRRLAFSGNAEDAPLIRERLASFRGDMVFFALDAPEARAVRPYVSGMLPVYATSLSVDPRADATVNVDMQGVRYGEMPWFVQPDHAAVMVYPQPKPAMAVERERLYALGIDAFRLALLILRGAPSPTLDGVTGRITLEGNGFARALTAAEVDGGKVVPAKSPQ